MTQALDSIRAEALVCQRCPLLVASRSQVVFGTGRAMSGLMIVGEAPGGEEDRRGQPFVGPAGHLLDAKLAEAGIVRDEAYVTNTVMCHPTAISGKDRPPSGLEVLSCASYLDRQVAAIRPRVIVALGATALRRLLGPERRVARDRGVVFDIAGISVVPTFHPSSLRWGRGRAEAMAQDLKKAAAELDLIAR